MQKYEVVAHTLELDGKVGDFDVIIKTDISLIEAQQLTIANIGKYAGDVWPQYAGNFKGFIQYRQLLNNHTCNNYKEEV